MKDIIKNILEIEEKANKIIEDGIKEKNQLIDQRNKDIDKMRADISAMVDSKLNQLAEQEKKEAEESIERINKTAEKRLQSMETLYQGKRELWVDSVFDIVIGSDTRES